MYVNFLVLVISGNITQLIQPTIQHLSNLSVIFLSIGCYESKTVKRNEEFDFIKKALGDSAKHLILDRLADLPVRVILISIMLFYYPLKLF
jgi:hypothetical protein